MLCAGLACVASAHVVGAQSERQAPVVQDAPLYDHPSWYRGPAADAPPPLPFPPLDQIPPVAMPDPALCISDPLGATSVIFHDAKTGLTVELPGDPWGLTGSGSVRGFGGSDGRSGWEHGGRAFEDRTQVLDTSEFPFRINAKAVMRRGENFSTCSASLIDAEVALLAGHCIYDPAGGYWDEIFIIPGWDGEGQHVPPPPDDVLNPYGWASGTQYLVGADWVSDGNYDRDMGVVALTRAVGMVTGWFGHAWGGTCPDIQARTYYNASYPGPVQCYNGAEMWIWHGTFDACPSNQLEIFTTAGCHSEVQNGMSGSSAYYVVEPERYAHAVCSNHLGSSAGRFCKMWQGFNTLLTPFINGTARGAALDIQPLDCNGPASALPGNVVVLNHLCTNPTNLDPPQQSYTFTWYLSGDEHITTADTALSTRSVQLNLGSLALDPAGAMARVVTMPPVQIPANTPPGTYWLGVIYDPATDNMPGNNAATTWDAHQILVGSSSP